MSAPDTVLVSRDPYAPIVIEHDGRMLYRIHIESGHASFHRDFPVDPDAVRVLRDDAERWLASGATSLEEVLRVTGGA